MSWLRAHWELGVIGVLLAIVIGSSCYLFAHDNPNQRPTSTPTAALTATLAPVGLATPSTLPAPVSTAEPPTATPEPTGTPTMEPSPEPTADVADGIVPLPRRGRHEQRCTGAPKCW